MSLVLCIVAISCQCSVLRRSGTVLLHCTAAAGKRLEIDHWGEIVKKQGRNAPLVPIISCSSLDQSLRDPLLIVELS